MTEPQPTTVPTHSPTTARSSPRPALSRERIVRQTRRFLDEHGLEALTMRRLAAELGVGTMSLYTYFRDKEELLEAAIEAGARQVPVPGPDGPWRERLRALMHALRAELVRAPAFLRMRAERPIMTPAAMRVGEAGMRALTDAGFGPREGAAAWRALFNLTFGFAAFTPRAPSEAERRRARAILLALPPEEYPSIAPAIDEMVDALDGEVMFDHALDLLLDGLEARLGTPEARR